MFYSKSTANELYGFRKVVKCEKTVSGFIYLKTAFGLIDRDQIWKA